MYYCFAPLARLDRASDYEIFDLKQSGIKPDTKRVPFFVEQIRHVLHLCCADNVALDEGELVNLVRSFIPGQAEFDNFYEVTQPFWSKSDVPLWKNMFF